MMVLEKRLVFSLGILAVLAAVFAGCGNPWMKAITAPLYKDKDAPEEPAQAGSDKAITGFTITSPVSATGFIDEGTKTIAVTVPYGTDVTGLTPDIIHTGVSVSPLSGTAQDFTNPVPYTVTAEDSSTVIYEVTVTAASVLNSIEAISAYLSTAAEPVSLPVHIDMASDWTNLLTAIATVSKTVELDLSVCTMSSTEFNPDNTISTGKQYVTALILPDTATSIAAGSVGNYTFRYFTNLREVDGEQVTDIGQYAFFGCSGLESVTLPAATNIGSTAFFECSSLESVTLPAATDIGMNAFFSCSGLTSVTLPAATNIGSTAFFECSSLNNLTFGKDTAPWPVLAGSAFMSTGTGSLTIHVPSGKLTDYTSAWGVLPYTAADGNTAIYGTNHKEITIVDY
jgi:hypothetical protein